MVKLKQTRNSKLANSNHTVEGGEKKTMNQIIEGSLRSKIEELIPAVDVHFISNPNEEECTFILTENCVNRIALNRYMKCIYGLKLIYRTTEDKRETLVEKLDHIMKNLNSFYDGNMRYKIKDKVGTVLDNELKVSFKISYKERIVQDGNTMKELKILKDESEE